ncbi:MAG: phosphoesterase, partial [bacterium]|nr:phosphoesterase [bacterium]
LRRFQDAGLEDRLRDRSLLVREQQVLNSAKERIEPFRELLDQLRRELPIDRAFLSRRALKELPGRDLLTPGESVLQRLSDDFEDIAGRMEEAISHADRELVAQVHEPWEERRKSVQQEYEKTLRDLRKASVDGEEFIRLRARIEELRPLQERRSVLERDLADLEQHRRNLLAEWEDLQGEAFRQLERAGKRVSRRLTGKVRVKINFAGNREPLFDLLRRIGGRLSEAIDRLRQRQTLSLKELADAMREGRGAVERGFGIPPAQADRLASAEGKVVMAIEELDLPPETRIELNVGSSTDRPDWKSLKDLSKGQKATAVLLLLLLDSKAPLVIDQPEDDLDNRFITEGVVPRMREEKRRRQFIFATHNANIPVLGDAELIVSLRAAGEAAEGQAELPEVLMGALEERAVREQVEEILEGGRPAFEMRRLKYGF